jgi:hypothetical protein
MKVFLATFCAIIAAAVVIYICGDYMVHDAQAKQQTAYYAEKSRKVADDALFTLSIWPGEPNDPNKCKFVMEWLKKKEQLTPEQRVKLATLRVECGINP